MIDYILWFIIGFLAGCMFVDNAFRKTTVCPRCEPEKFKNLFKKDDDGKKN